MHLNKEIEFARKEIVADGYDMSFGELLNLYRDEEIIIHPEFQRLFRWDNGRKTKFIESILLGLPLPPIFVYQSEDGIWELIDGLQRLSTIFQFVGVLKNPEGGLYQPLELEGTKFLPSLNGKKWESDDGNEIGQSQQLQIKRSRIRVEILRQESDSLAKYELFQRLNTGGSNLSPQEIRNSVGYMVNPSFQRWVKELAGDKNFLESTSQTDSAIEKEIHTELVVRFLAYRNIPYQSGLDVHEYLDEALLSLASSQTIDFKTEEKIFKETFNLINEALGDKAFKRWNGSDFAGKFLISVYEVIALGVSYNLDSINKMSVEDACKFIEAKNIELWSDRTFEKYSGAGIRGTSRLANLLPLAERFF